MHIHKYSCVLQDHQTETSSETEGDCNNRRLESASLQ